MDFKTMRLKKGQVVLALEVEGAKEAVSKGDNGLYVYTTAESDSDVNYTFGTVVNVSEESVRYPSDNFKVGERVLLPKFVYMNLVDNLVIVDEEHIIGWE